jgi:uncharacterized protein (DUF1499 family)
MGHRAIKPFKSRSIMASKKPLFSFSGTRPANLGVTDGKLAPCPSSPNCVCSYTPDTDKEHSIAPIACKSPGTAIATLKSIIQGMERTEIIHESGDYLRAEFTSGLMGYVDDVEFYINAGTSVVNVRSASRLGKSDLGVNRQRVEAIRAQFAQAEG